MTSPQGVVVGVDASRAYRPRPTGTETYASELIRALVGRGSERYVLYTRLPPRDPPAGAEVRVLASPRLWTHTRLALEVARRPPGALFIPAHVMPAVCRVPCVVTVHDLGHRAFPKTHTWWQRQYLEWTTRRHVRGAAALIADSSSTARDLTEAYGVPASRIRVAPLGVAPRFRPLAAGDVDEVRFRAGLRRDQRYFLHVGTVQPRKNLDTLVEAFAVVAGRRPDLALVLAGARGWGHCRPEETARRLGVADRVLRLGYAPGADLPALYSGALACALPSLYEGFGLTALESMACGSPVVGSTASSVPEVVGDTGLLVDPTSVDDVAAALARLADEASLRATLARAATRRAAGFTWGRTARIVADVLVAVARR
ncbi:MAG: glycosyltransferase family 4 protein [Anaerolineae bacterium]